MNSRCASLTVTRLRPSVTSPFCCQPLITRLTVWSVVPDISAMSSRVTGKSISIPLGVLRPGLVHQPQDGVGDAPLDCLRGQLANTAMGVLQP